MKKAIICFIVLSVVLLCFTACEGNGEKKTEIHLDYGAQSGLNKVVTVSAAEFAAYKNSVVDDRAVIDWVDADGNSVDFTDIADGDTVYAKWGVRVVFMTETEEVLATLYGVPGEALNAPTSMLKKGYSFDGWLETNTLTRSDALVFPEKNSSYMPIFRLVNYSIKYNLNGGKCSEQLKTSYNILDEIALPVATKAGYVFCGWMTSANETVTRISGRAEDLNLTASFTPTNFSAFLRSDTATITDSGRVNQKYDYIDLNKYVSLSALAANGYTSVDITVTLDVKEVDDGYQYCFLYADGNVGSNAYSSSLAGFFDRYILGQEATRDDPSFLAGYQFEHGPGKKNTSWATYNLKFTVSTADLVSLGHGNLYIRYGASGKFDDNWQNRNVKLTFTAYQTFN